MTAGGLESWHSGAFVEQWAGDDILADLLALPRRISAALVADDGHPVEHVVDVGAGAGPYLRVFLDAFPGARGTWVDSSAAMEELGPRELAPYGSRVEFVLADAERFGDAPVAAADVVVTSRMLHHFSPETLRAFYVAAHARLRPGGFLFDLDHCGAPPEWDARYRRIRSQFTGRRKRELKPHRHDFPLASVEERLAAVASARFEQPDVPWRTFYTALIAARKPA